MPGTDYAGNPASFPSTVHLGDDTQAPTCALVNPALEGTLDRTANLNQRVTHLEGHDGSHRIVAIGSTVIDDGTFNETKRWDASMTTFDPANAYLLMTISGLLAGDIVDVVGTSLLFGECGDSSSHTFQVALMTKEGAGSEVQEPGCLKPLVVHGTPAALQSSYFDVAWQFRHVMAGAGTLSLYMNGKTDGVVAAFASLLRPYSFSARVLRVNA